VGLTERDLLSHVLILGATGAGKTTLLIQAMRQLISGSRSQPIGLIIFDPKVDETVEMVRVLARAAQREQDLVVLGPEGDHRFDLFGQLHSLADVDFLTRRLLAGTKGMGHQNAYWDEARYGMLNAAMTLLVTGHAGVSFEQATEFLHSWFFNLRTAPKIVTQTVDRTRQFLKKPKATPAMLRQVQNALDQVELWKELDHRTRSNIQSSLINALRPLLSVMAAKCIETTGRPTFDPGRIANLPFWPFSPKIGGIRAGFKSNQKCMPVA
jgi:energy-coupling factor transporter ATP-binding protein EcfA2